MKMRAALRIDHWAAALTIACAVASSTPVWAQSNDDRIGIHAGIGLAEHGGSSAGIGILVPWQGFQRQWLNAQWQGHWDVSLERWRAKDRRHTYHSTLALALIPTLRIQPSSAQAWFIDTGLGVVLTNRHYANRSKRLSTRYNFASHFGLGLWLDRERSHELTIRVQHVSNAGIKRPNPGENFLQLRYAHKF